jgi:hypothetical protein
MNKRYSREEAAEMFANTDNELIKTALQFNTTKLLDPECVQYLTHYEKEFAPLRNKKIKLLEIGVKDGESLKLWKEYFHKDSEIVGIDISDEYLNNFDEPGVELFFGDQSDIEFLSKVKNSGPFDVIIDDGGHTMFQMRASFEYLFRYGLANDGMYIIEDLGTCYWYKWSGGIGRSNTMMSRLKELVDSVNHRFWKGGRVDYIPIPPYNVVDADYFDENITEVKFCKGLAFIKKGNNKFQ